MDYIKIRGARQHNLKNVDLDIPKNKLVTLTGVSGSGKSSLAFDTLYAEGQRRYVESLSSYARQFLGIMQKPDIDSIEGLSPAISIDQKTTSHNPRSTVGTVTEIYDYLRLLFARVGHPHCPLCGREISHQSLDEIVASGVEVVKSLSSKNSNNYYMVLSPIVSQKKGEYSSLFENLKAKGYTLVRIDGRVFDLSEEIVLIKTNKHSIDVVIDKLSIAGKDLGSDIYRENLRSRLSDSFSQSLNLSEGNVILSKVEDKSFEFPKSPKVFSDHLFSEKFACPVDNVSLSEIEPRTFSFNSPQGACENCSGLGKILKVEESLVFSKSLTIKEGAILPFSKVFENDTWYGRLLLTVCSINKIPVDVPLENLDNRCIEILLHGTGDQEYKVPGTNRFGNKTFIVEKFRGIEKELETRFKETDSDWVREEIKKYMREQVCDVCEGMRLKKEALSITIDNKSISAVTNLSIEITHEWIGKLLSQETTPLTKREYEIGLLILKEIKGRLNFLVSVGLNYLTLSRPAGSLSGGEAQRIRLASQIGSGLTGVLYVLDEPTIGLHPRDNQRLINTLKALKDLGNTVVVVEHDSDMIKSSEYIVDFGPGAGKEGGNVVAQGTLDEIQNNPKSITGPYLSGRKKISVDNGQEKIDTVKPELVISGCTNFNLKNIKANFPLGKFIVVTGVSGSGKSTLLVETLYPALAARLNPKFKKADEGGYKNITGYESLDKVILIDQSPIGKTPRSNPATYTGVFDPIRDAFVTLRDSKLNGYKKGRFSFNVKGGRCENCEGQGQIKIEMQFMSDVWVKCDVCHGSRYNESTLGIKLHGKNISEVLNMRVSEALEFFAHNHKIVQKLQTLSDVGLSYIELGQSATTLSGGEAQRVKLSTELSRRDSGRNFYILDEPTTGLHFSDVESLLRVLKILVKRGNTVVVIEHNLDIIKSADWIIDLGPDGGEKGGKLVYQGNLGGLKKCVESFTAKYI